MPKVTKPAEQGRSQIERVPPKLKPVTAGYDPGWDLREVDSTYLVAELVRRGECPKLQPAKPVQTAKPEKKASLFG